MVDYYGTLTPLNQVSTISIPEPRLITLQPYEKTLIPVIEKAIMPAVEYVAKANNIGPFIWLAYYLTCSGRSSKVGADLGHCQYNQWF